MSASTNAGTVAPTPPAAVTAGAGRIRFVWVLRSEWTKLRSVRSTYWTLVVTVVAFIGISAGVCAGAAYGAHHLRQGGAPTTLSLVGLFFAQLSLGVLGVLVIASEYSTGMIRASFSAVSRRWELLTAKAAVFGSVALVVGLVASFISFFVGQAILSSGNYPSVTLGQAGVLRTVVGGALYLAVMGLLALGIGALIRHTAGGIAVLFGLILVLPSISAALLPSWQNVLDKVLPSNAGGSLISMHTQAPFLGPWAGFGVLCAWAAATLALAAFMATRRDA
ncbi:MAG: ABC transporter permease [Acidimicrobiales bacterium]